MGIADMDFRAAPAITKALAERMQHENWGYLDMNGAYVKSYIQGIVDWNKRRYGITVNPDNAGADRGRPSGLIAALLDLLAPRQQSSAADAHLQRLLFGSHRSRLKAEESPLKLVNGRYSMDFEDLERRISHETNTLISATRRTRPATAGAPRI